VHEQTEKADDSRRRRIAAWIMAPGIVVRRAAFFDAPYPKQKP